MILMTISTWSDSVLSNHYSIRCQIKNKFCDNNLHNKYVICEENAEKNHWRQNRHSRRIMIHERHTRFARKTEIRFLRKLMIYVTTSVEWNLNHISKKFCTMKDWWRTFIWFSLIELYVIQRTKLKRLWHRSLEFNPK